MGLTQETLTRFVEITASDAPAPGGGSISALAGSLAAALGQMVANLTMGRAKYAEAQEAMEQVCPFLAEKQQVLLRAVEEDSDAFNQYMDALKLPKGTDEEKAARQAAMQAGLKTAARVPLGVAQTAAELLPGLKTVLLRGNPNSVTDAMVAVMMARTAVLGAVFNVRVNLRSIRDEAFCEELEMACAELQSRAVTAEREILGNVEFSGF